MQLPLESALKDVHMAFCGVPGIHDLLEALAVKPSSVLEIGAGSSKISLNYAIRGATVLATDIDPQMVMYGANLKRAAESLLAAAGDKRQIVMAHMQADAQELRFPDERFDLVLNEGLLEHGDRDWQLRILREMARTAKKWVVILVPDAAHPESQRIHEEVHHHYEGIGETETPLTGEEVDELLRQGGFLRWARGSTLARWWIVVAAKDGWKRDGVYEHTEVMFVETAAEASEQATAPPA